MSGIIKDSVGLGGANIKDDVLLVQKLLNKQFIPGVSGPLKEDALVGKNTISRIEIFQKHVVKMIRPDGRVDPNGKTIKILSLPERASPLDQSTDGSLTLSVKGVRLLKSIESLALKPYDDQSGREIKTWVKGATIGYGHLIARSEWEQYKRGITESAANLLFSKDLLPFIQGVKSKLIGNVKQNEFDALVIFAFNIGIASFRTSSVIKLINDPSAITPYPNLETAWKAWNKSQGKEMRGLNNRRNAEWDIYSKNIYKKW